MTEPGAPPESRPDTPSKQTPPPETPAGTAEAHLTVSRGDGFDGIHLEVARVPEAVERRVAGWRTAGLSIGLVPVLGEPHVGHLTLIDTAAEECDRVVVVAQAGVEVLTEPSGLRLLSSHGANLLFVPMTAGAPAFASDVGAGVPAAGGSAVEDLMAEMEGRFNRQPLIDSLDRIEAWSGCVGPDSIYQSGTRYQMATLLAARLQHQPRPPLVKVVDAARGPGGITPVAEIDRLDQAQRDQVAALQRVLQRMAARLLDGVSTPAAEIAWARDALASAGFEPPDYLDVREARTLVPVDQVTRTTRIFIAIRLGDIRLVDSVPVDGAAGTTPVALSL